MKVLHVAPHLGGGVGKAHSSLAGAELPSVRRHYLLLEAPRDRRHVDALLAGGATITIEPDDTMVARLAADADIVQFEWWNHPRIYQCLCRTPWPAMRTVVWCHISGLAAPFVPTELMVAADRFLFTSACSLAAPQVAALPGASRDRLGVVNSGFGIAAARRHPHDDRRPGSVGYLGTVDFSKLSPDLFAVVDLVERVEPVSVWGSVDPDGEVTAAVARMRHPDRIRLLGQADDPAAAFAATQIFLYLLRPDHFGTAENALVEAMSCGCTPLVFANPAEMAIVEDGVTGFVVHDTTEAARRLQWMLLNPAETIAIGRNAARHVAATRTPQASAAAFAAIYDDLLGAQKREVDFRRALGSTAAEWFLGTQPSGAAAQAPALSGRAAKGSLDHFLACFPRDASLLELAGPRDAPEAAREARSNQPEASFVG